MKSKLQAYDFNHTGIMTSETQSIPLGNGDLGVNVWAENDGLFLLLSKTDNWSELYRILKTGLFKLKFNPNPFNDETIFSLSLYDGVLNIEDKKTKTSIIIYVDANYPAYNISVTSENKLVCEVEIINYRDKEYFVPHDDFSNYHMGQEACDYDGSYNLSESADIVYSTCENMVGQYHKDNWSCYDKTLEIQGLDGYKGKDPFINRTFGFIIYSDEMSVKDTGVMVSKTSCSEYSFKVFTLNEQYEKVLDWKEDIEQLHKRYKENLAGHKKYWNNEWEKSYIFATGSEQAYVCTKGYIYQRYFNLCAGRGKAPIKFNGSIFCVEPSPHVTDKKNFDYRAWGAPFWLQNTRLIYWNMLFAGDFETIIPFFDMYYNSLDFSKNRTKEYFGHEGAFFPETMSFYGAYANRNFGWNRTNRHKSFVDNNYIRWYYCGALEVSFMMLKYYEYTNDTALLESKLLPFIKEILVFYDQHFEKLDGTMLIKPTASLETWQDCVNDTPTIAGILAITSFIDEFAIGDECLRTLCDTIKKSLPEIPFGKKDNLDVIKMCHINIDEKIRNCENPELYTVFPYYLHGLGKENLQEAINTYNVRLNQNKGGWQQHGPQAAILGLTDEAFANVYSNFAQQNVKFTFPAYWGPNYDWTPDQDNGNVAGIGLTQMLLQSDSKTLRVLPTWDMGLDVEFKLPTAQNGEVIVEYKNGSYTKFITNNISDNVVIIK